MTFDVPFLIEYLTGFATLHPGDLILTGSPGGTEPLHPGDRIDIDTASAHSPTASSATNVPDPHSRVIGQHPHHRPASLAFARAGPETDSAGKTKAAPRIRPGYCGIGLRELYANWSLTTLATQLRGS